MAEPPDAWRDPRIPALDKCVLRYVLDKWAASQPEKDYAVFADGERWSYAETQRRARATAAALLKLGVKQGDHVACWLPIGKHALQAMLGINYLGAVYVPFNTAYRGSLLEHVLDNSDARVLIADATLIERLGDVATALVEQVVVVAGETQPIAGLEMLNEAAFALEGIAVPAPERVIQPWDTQSIIYTSGTTGPSKGVLSSYLHAYSNMGPEAWPVVRQDDRYLVTLPMFHVGGSFICNIMLCHGASVAIDAEFSTERFWATVKKTGATMVFLLGVMATFLAKRPPCADDRDHTMRLMFMVPLLDDVAAFADRFGVAVYTIFNMTEVATPTFSAPNPQQPGTCGRVRDGVEVRLVDEFDCEVAPGTVGEMVVRMDRPWGMNHGYYKNPQATVSAWRNGWFHTGDAFRQDDDGNFYFVDRIKDAIRRRGENISSYEVETEVAAYADVREAAAIPVPNEYGDDDVMVVVAPVNDVALAPEALFDFLIPRMAHFMLPRYVRVVDELPKTPTAKVQKHKLRDAGVTKGTWDREAHGIRVTRHGVQRA